jgi:hypothetical protein
MRLIDQLVEIMTNEEFTPRQRKEQAAIAIDESKQDEADAHPTSLALDAAISKHRNKVSGGIRFSFDEDTSNNGDVR